MQVTLPAPSIVIFDMDGTTVRHIDPRLLHIMEWLDDTSHWIGSIFRWFFKSGTKGEPLDYFENYQNRKKPRLLVHRAIHKMRRREVDQIVEPCPFVYDVLDLLQAHNIPLALASNGLGKGYGHDVLETFDLKKYFTATIFREDIRKSKPHPEAILLALKEMKIKPTAKDVIWYIGDRHKDIKAALAANDRLPCRVVPIAYALNAAVAALENGLGPEHILPNYEDMLDVLGKLLTAPTATAMAHK